MNEIQQKLTKFRSLMAEHSISAVRLKGVDWFGWITAGGSSTVILTAEKGIAEVFITLNQAYILTNCIEYERLKNEELSSHDFEYMVFPWEEDQAALHFAHSHVANKENIFSDYPVNNEKLLPFTFKVLRMVLLPEEINRYQQIGRLAAEAMTEAIIQAEPHWRENQLAGVGARSLWSRGLHPTLVLVGGEERLPIYRHPIATEEKLGSVAMMVFCARAFGLYANLTRFIFFREPSQAERQAMIKVATVEAAIFNGSVAGQKLPSLYEVLKNAYQAIGEAENIHLHHQGGATGYQSREVLAAPNGSQDFTLQNNMALAWNPSLPGAKIEDTVLLQEGGIAVLTKDPKWPTFELSGRLRPDVWLKK